MRGKNKRSIKAKFCLVKKANNMSTLGKNAGNLW